MKCLVEVLLQRLNKVHINLHDHMLVFGIIGLLHNPTELQFQFMA